MRIIQDFTIYEDMFSSELPHSVIQEAYKMLIAGDTKIENSKW